MGNLEHFRVLYLRAFEGCKPRIVVTALKLYGLFCAIFLVMAVYAFVYRMLTGFEF